MNDLTVIKQSEQFLQLQNNIDLAVEESKAIIIFEESDVEKAGFYIKNFKELGKKVEQYRKSITDPINAEVKQINAFFKKLSTEFTSEQDRLVKESNEILREIRARQEAERLKEQKELEDAVLDEAEMFNDPSVIDNIPQVEYKQQKVQSENLTTVRNKKWRVIDIDLVPKEYLTINEDLINQLRKNYDFEVKPQPIAGIEFYFDETVRVK